MANPGRWFRFGMALVTVSVVVACDDVAGPSGQWRCDVTLMLGHQTGRGSGTGATQDAALSSARANACAQLGLNGSERSLCERGQAPRPFTDWSNRHDCNN